MKAVVRSETAAKAVIRYICGERLPGEKGNVVTLRPRQLAEAADLRAADAAKLLRQLADQLGGQRAKGGWVFRREALQLWCARTAG